MFENHILGTNTAHASYASNPAHDIEGTRSRQASAISPRNHGMHYRCQTNLEIPKRSQGIQTQVNSNHKFTRVKWIALKGFIHPSRYPTSTI
jgi:hypothetical protein